MRKNTIKTAVATFREEIKAALKGKNSASEIVKAVQKMNFTIRASILDK